MQTRKLGKGEGVSHGGPTREGNPGWGCFLTRGVRPPVWVQGLQQPGVVTGQSSHGESRCLASHLCPPNREDWEVKAGGPGTAFQMERGTSGCIDRSRAWICGNSEDRLDFRGPHLSSAAPPPSPWPAPLCRAR